MRKLIYVTLIAWVTFSIQSCSGPNGSKAGANSVNDTKADVAKNDSTIVAVDKDDAKFAVAAANGGMGEVEMGKLAQEKAVNAKVKDYGAMMVNDHSKVNDELKALAKSKGITLPGVLDKDEQNAKDKLSAKSGTDFDKAYVKSMVDDHKADIKDFEKAAKNLKDPDLKAFALKTLPILNKHLETIEKIHNGMK